MIIRHTNQDNVNYEYFNIYPDVFVSQDKLKSKDYVKQTMDFFYNIAVAQYTINWNTFKRNYDLLMGKLTKRDFFIAEDSMGNKMAHTEDLVQSLIKDIGLPEYVKHYPILNTPINILLAEYTSRNKSYMVRAMDDDSKSEVLEFRSELLNKYIIDSALLRIVQSLIQEGKDLKQVDVNQLKQMAIEEVRDEIMSYTTRAEIWGNTMLDALNVNFNMMYQEMRGLLDMLLSSRMFFLIDEDSSKLGFYVQRYNPVKVWYLPLPDREFTKDWYCAGTIDIMEISEIIEKFPWLTKEEIDELRKELMNNSSAGPEGRPSNLFDKSNESGINTIKYDTYSPVIVQERMFQESFLLDPQYLNDSGSLEDLLGISNNVSSYGYKFVVTRAYWLGKKKIKKVTFIDDDGIEQTFITDEKYKNGTLPTEVEVVEGWVNQWYKGVKIGDIIYHVEEFKLFNYCPIIGAVLNSENTAPTSFFDLAKPYQVIYNICMNQLYSLLDKEIGKVIRVNLRNIYIPKDSSPQDALDLWIERAKVKGIVIEEDNPEMMKAPSTTGGRAADVLDLTLSEMINSRIQLAQAARMECWNLLGFTPNRMGEVMDRQTAGSVKESIAQSFAQTEIYFIQHGAIMREVYQAMLDAAQYIESTKPSSTINYVTSKGSSMFLNVSSEDIRLKDLHVFVTFDNESRRILNMLQSLAPAAMQSGADIYDILKLFTSTSIRQAEKVFKDLKEKKQQIEQQQAQIQQQGYQTNIQLKQAEMQKDIQLKQAEMQFEAAENEKDRQLELELARMKVEGDQLKGEDGSVYTKDSLEKARLNLEKQKLDLKRMQVENKRMNDEEKLRLKELEMMLDRDMKRISLLITKLQQHAKEKRKEE